MGVTGLWTVVQPCARPIKIETLNKKRLAVDASIWIYQFLKAVRDKEGNALRNSHVVGFFRRICKLLFVGIQPVFVFDGGAPSLKRQTITARRRRREGRKEDAARTAGKMLALQMQRAAEEEDARRKREAAGAKGAREEEAVPEDLVYVDELQMTQQERMQNRKFRKKDQYHLPELETSMAEMGAPNDPRIMSLEELEAYARQFDTGEDINVYDFSKIDFDSPFFTSLPASDRYNILNAARLRSRLRMGYSKEQLDSMFPNRMDFSRFQIERVSERNELTQRLMNINGMNDDGMWGVNGTGRVAGERGREYVLVKNDGVEGGWALGVVTAKEEGQKEKPIDIDAPSSPVVVEEEQSDEDFEDVPIEGLNRLPKPGSSAFAPAQDEISQRRKTLYAARRSRGGTSRPRKRRKVAAQNDDPNSLFVADDAEEELEDGAEVEEGEEAAGTDEEELNRAIAMSMQKDGEDADETDLFEPEESEAAPILQQRRVDDAPSFKDSNARGGRAIASTVNARAAKARPSALFQAEDDSDDNDEEGSRNPYPSKPSDEPKKTKDQERATNVQQSITDLTKPKPKQKSEGPLPFEKLDLGASLFGKKKMKEIEQRNEGGFEKDTGKQNEQRELPPWFSGDLDSGMQAQQQIERDDREKAKKFRDEQQFQFDEPAVLRRQHTREVVDLDAPEKDEDAKEVMVIDEEEMDERTASQRADGPQTMGDIAENIKTAPVVVPPPNEDHLPPVIRDVPKPDTEDASVDGPGPTANAKANGDMRSVASEEDGEEDEDLAWSASEDEKPSVPVAEASSAPGQKTDTVRDKSESPEFEDVDIPDRPEAPQAAPLAAKVNDQEATTAHVSGTADQNAPAETEHTAADEEDYGLVTDSEDEELMRQLEIEAQEHGRFASELNAKSQATNIAEYEKELKTLRTQQKKDRRDADEVTQIMITECQQLLRLFGLPYITAPMEAEAQCAELVHLGLVDGIVTDDSDCFLFGGTRIYKNMFNQAKFVECYLLSDLEKEFDLTRQKLIGIAQLLGSDYTEGLPGVGPVTALEILSEFPDLTDFRTWWADVQEGRRKREEDAAVVFRRKFRKTNATKLFLPPGFPDPRVEMAYMQPETDKDPSEFQWGVPDLDALRSFLMATIGWNQERTDEVLVPVIRDMNKRAEEGTQSNITKFFGGGVGAGAAGDQAYAPRVRAAEGSKRLGGALGRLAERAKAKQRRARKGVDDDEVEEDGNGAHQGDGNAEDDSPAPVAKARKSRKRKSNGMANGGDGQSEDEEIPKAKKPKRKPRARKKKAQSSEEDSD